MPEMADVIEDKIIELLKLESALDAVTFDREERAVIPNAYYPLLIASIDEQDEITDATTIGNISESTETGQVKYVYTGHIAAETRQADQITKKNRILERGSKSVIRTLLDTCTRMFEKYPRLDNLTSGTELVRYVIRTGPKTNGFIDREDNLYNRGDFQFAVVTSKDRGV